MLLGLVAGVGLAFAFATALSAGDGRPQTSADLYSRLAEAARQGDVRAQEQVAAVDAYLAERGLSPDKLTMPEFDSADTQAQVGGARLAVEDAGPWRITISNTTTFTNSGELATYIGNRKSVLVALARTDQARRLEAVVHPNGRQPVAAFLAGLSCPCEGVSFVVDVYGPQGWLMASGSDLSASSVRESAAQLEAQILDLAAQSLDIFPGITRADLRAEVRSVRLSMSTASALATSNRANVLLVDVLADLEDAYAGRSALVEVTGAPDVTEAHRRLVLSDPVGANPIEPVRR